MNKKNFLLLSLVFAVGVYADSQVKKHQHSTDSQTTYPAGRILSEPQVKSVSATTDTSWRVAQQKKEATSDSQAQSDAQKASSENSQESTQQGEQSK